MDSHNQGDISDFEFSCFEDLDVYSLFFESVAVGEIYSFCDYLFQVFAVRFLSFQKSHELTV